MFTLTCSRETVSKITIITTFNLPYFVSPTLWTPCMTAKRRVPLQTAHASNTPYCHTSCLFSVLLKKERDGRSRVWPLDKWRFYYYEGKQYGCWRTHFVGVLLLFKLTIHLIHISLAKLYNNSINFIRSSDIFNVFFLLSNCPMPFFVQNISWPHYYW